MTESHFTSLSKYIATSGVAARRKVLELIKNGLIFVNDKVITEPGHKIGPDDVVKYQDQIVRPERKVYIVLNKPRNCITTASDEHGRRTVLELIQDRNLPRIFSVGRLDRNTTGLLLLTNDGELAQRLGHPRYMVDKAYTAILDRPIESIDLDKIRSGVRLQEGRIKPDKIYAIAGSKKRGIVIEIHSGQNRIIRRIFEHFGYEVTSLDRFQYACLTKKGLPCGAWRYLTPREIAKLMQLVRIN